MQLREALGELPETVFADLLESDDAYLLVIDLPGVTAETLDVTVECGRLRSRPAKEKTFPESSDISPRNVPSFSMRIFRSRPTPPVPRPRDRSNEAYSDSRYRSRTPTVAIGSRSRDGSVV